MKNRTFEKTITVLLLFFAFQFVSACDRIGEAVEFQIWSGNVTLPPEYQREQVIRGKINPNSVTVNFSDRKGENEVERKFEFTGEDYKMCVEMIRNTELKKRRNISEGASSFDVTLKDRVGKSEAGTLSNGNQWREFSRKIEQMAGV